MNNAIVVVACDPATKGPLPPDPEHPDRPHRIYGAECSCGWVKHGLSRVAATAQRAAHQCPDPYPGLSSK